MNSALLFVVIIACALNMFAIVKVYGEKFIYYALVQFLSFGFWQLFFLYIFPYLRSL